MSAILQRCFGAPSRLIDLHPAQTQVLRVAIAALCILGTLLACNAALGFAILSWSQAASLSLIPVAIALFAYFLPPPQTQAPRPHIEMQEIRPYRLSRREIDFIEIDLQEIKELPQMRLEPEVPFSFKDEEIDFWLQNPQQNLICNGRERPLCEAEVIILQNRQLIKLHQLKSGLYNCAVELKKRMSDEPYAICCTPYKSSAWVAEYLVENFMQRKPRAHFTHADGSSKENGAASEASCTIGSVDPGIKNFLVCEDVAYSGAQLISVIRDISAGVREAEQYHLYVVCPFLSPTAKQRIRTEVGLYQQLQIHFISTNFKMQTKREAFYGKSRLLRELPINGFEATMTITEWKVPDGISLTACLGRGGFYHQGEEDEGKVYAVTPDPSTLPVYKRQGPLFSFVAT